MEPRNRDLEKFLKWTISHEKMAERVGFEPTVPFRVHTLSKRAPSTTRTSLQPTRLRSVELTQVDGAV